MFGRISCYGYCFALGHSATAGLVSVFRPKQRLSQPPEPTTAAAKARPIRVDTNRPLEGTDTMGAWHVFLAAIRPTSNRLRACRPVVHQSVRPPNNEVSCADVRAVGGGEGPTDGKCLSLMQPSPHPRASARLTGYAVASCAWPSVGSTAYWAWARCTRRLGIDPFTG